LAGPRFALERVISRGAAAEEDLALLRRSREELDRLASGIGAILSAAYGKPPRQRPMNLVALVVEAADSCLLEFPPDRVEIDGPPRIDVSGDRDQLQGAIANVIRNALAYSPADSRVTIKVSGLGRRARISIADRGPGIAPGEAVFGPFVRGSAGQSTREGNGLGLFIARRVVEAHGGILSLSSSARGSVFTIELPSRPARQLPAATRSQAG
jgi:signal transduction histidine kinase